MKKSAITTILIVLLTGILFYITALIFNVSTDMGYVILLLCFALLHTSLILGLFISREIFK